MVARSGWAPPKKSPGFPWQLMVMACSVPPHLMVMASLTGRWKSAPTAVFQSASERPRTKAPSAHSRVYSLQSQVATSTRHKTVKSENGSKWIHGIFIVRYDVVFMFKQEHQCFKGNSKASGRCLPIDQGEFTATVHSPRVRQEAPQVAESKRNRQYKSS